MCWHIFTLQKQYSLCLPIYQNHKKAEVGRNLWRASGPIPLTKQGHLELVVQDHL